MPSAAPLLAFAAALALCAMACGAALPTPRTITVGIRHENMHVLRDRLNEIADPRSASYGDWLSLDELSKIVSPSQQSIDAVSQWLRAEWCVPHLRFTHGREWVSGEAHCAPAGVDVSHGSIALPPHLRAFADVATLAQPAATHRPRRSAVLPSAAAPAAFPHRALAVADAAAQPPSLSVFVHLPAGDRAALAVANLHVAVDAAGAALPPPSSAFVGAAQCHAASEFAFTEHARRRRVQHFLAAAHPADIVCVTEAPYSSLSPDVLGRLVHVRARLCSARAHAADSSDACLQWTTAGAVEGGALEGALPTLLAADTYPPNTQKQVYDMPVSLSGSNETNAQLVWGTGTYGYSPDDLQKFYSDFDVDNSISLTSAVGMEGKEGGANWVEATLDIQYVSGMGTGVRSFVVNNDNSTAAEAGGEFGPAFVRFSKDLANNPSPPYTISISLGSLSWASCNKLCEQAVAMKASPSLQECNKYTRGLFQVCMYDDDLQVKRIDEELMKLGSRGVTVFGAAGDGGNHFSFGAFNPLNSLGRALNEISCNYTLPTYPASSPYVIGVGGTQMKGDTPIGCSSLTGGGITGGCGFSMTFDGPDWQTAQVSAYLAAINQTAAGAPNFNAKGRAYPDVSGIASGVPIVEAGRTSSVGGTSASTPEVAGMFSIINDQRLNSGLPPLGYFNPRLYTAAAANPSLFVDVTSGTSRCGTDKCCTTGFDAISGWDVFTGFGQPVFSAWLQEFGSD